MAQQNNSECTTFCWRIAAVVGVLAMIMLYALGGFGVLQAIITGGVIGVVLGVVLVFFICRTQQAADDKPAQSPKAVAPAPQQAPVADPQPTAPAATPDAAATVAEPDAAVTKPSGFVMQPSKKLPGQEELATRKGDWKYTNTEAPAKPAPTPAPATGDDMPALLDVARPEGADDLKLISGVGPKLEATLNELGIFHYDQIAVWGPKDIAWVDERLRFKGRIERDDWMSQARILAEGGETEFSKKKKK